MNERDDASAQPPSTGSSIPPELMDRDLDVEVLAGEIVPRRSRTRAARR